MGFCPGAFGMLWRDGDVWEVHARGCGPELGAGGSYSGQTPLEGVRECCAASHQRSLFSRVRRVDQGVDQGGDFGLVGPTCGSISGPCHLE